MPSKHLFKGVIHDIGHHSLSIFSWLHPHLGKGCEEAGVTNVTLDLLAKKPYPPNFPISKPLRISTATFRERFKEMVAKQGLDISQIKKAILYYDFSRTSDFYSPDAISYIELKDGTKYQHIFGLSISFADKINMSDINIILPKGKTGIIKRFLGFGHG